MAAYAPSPTCVGADGASFLLPATHFFARAMPSQSNKQISEPDLRQMAPAVAAGCHHDHALQAKKEPRKKRKAERRKTQGP
jgi:hypothetical protein